MTSGARSGSPNYSAAVTILGLTILADGFDNQILALTVPAIMKAWAVSRSAFAPALTLGLLAAAAGAAAGGALGDRFGRRPVLIVAVAWFGLATLALAWAKDIPTLGLLRFLGGLGIGAAMPNASSLIAELVSAPRRSMAITLGAACVPLGGIIGGLVAARIMPVSGWQTGFIIGGVGALATAAALAIKTPESPGFLAARAARTTTGTQRRFASTERVFGRELRRDTIAFWGAALFSMFAIFSILSWLPAILSEAGYPLQFVGLAMATVNFGGLVAGLACAFAMTLFGSRPVALTIAAVGGWAALATALVGVSPDVNQGLLLTLFALQGGCVGGITVLLYPLGAQIYPAAIRARGIGWGVGAGRAAAVASPIVAGAILSRLGASGFFSTVAVAAGACLICLSLIRNHAPPARTRLAGA